MLGLFCCNSSQLSINGSVFSTSVSKGKNWVSVVGRPPASDMNGLLNIFCLAVNDFDLFQSCLAFLDTSYILQPLLFNGVYRLPWQQSCYIASCSHRAFRQSAENMPWPRSQGGKSSSDGAFLQTASHSRPLKASWRSADRISASAVDERNLLSLTETIKAVIYCRCYKKKSAFNQTPVCQPSVWQINMHYIFSSVSDNQMCYKRNLVYPWLADWLISVTPLFKYWF